MSEENVEIVRLGYERRYPRRASMAFLQLCATDFEVRDLARRCRSLHVSNTDTRLLEAFAIWPEQWD